MKAAVVRTAGPPEVLDLCEVPTPVPEPGWVLVRVKAIGLNRSEMFTRQGHYAADPANIAAYPPADVSVDHIGDLADDELTAYLGRHHAELMQQEQR